MKKILYFLLAGIILTAVIWACEKNAVERKSQDPSNHGPSTKLTSRENGTCLDTTCCALVGTGITRQVKVPGYEPCEAIVTFDLYTCTNCNDTLSRYVFNNISVVLNDDSCTVLKNRWDSLHTATNYNLENSEMDAFYKAAIEKVEIDVVTTLSGSSVFRNLYPCSGYHYLFHTEYYSAMCYVWCVTDYPSATPPYTALTKLICGDICCVKSTLWCWNGSALEKHPGTPHTYGSTCGDSYSGCPGGGRTVGTDCDSHPCE
ncbi:MAG: hypothetical protein IPL42_12295 [Saprospiraceae bacterium]|nr:hypothetical protein [Saprospiraceae bacterium]